MKARAIVLPLALLAVLLAALVFANPARFLETAAPPAEELTFERVEMQPGKIVLHVRNAVAAQVTIAQVLIDDAYWAFSADPGPELDRYARATITLDYPWVEGEPHVVKLLTASGLAWEHEIAVATATPVPEPAAFGTYGLIGLLVGVLPIVAGMALFPAMRDAGEGRVNLLLAFTLGLLAFLAVDTASEGIELAGEAPGAFQGLAVLVGAALVAVIAVLALDGWLKARGAGAFSLALLIAIGIGLHNLGEGLVIGSAFAIGSLALGTALIVGFALHNVTEGPAIVAPLLRRGELGPARFAGLAALAGLPTVAGAWMGAFWSAGLLPVIFFGLGAGAIVVVLLQVGGALRRDGANLAAPGHLVAFGVGYLVMLATAFFTSA